MQARLWVSHKNRDILVTSCISQNLLKIARIWYILLHYDISYSIYSTFRIFCILFFCLWYLFQLVRSFLFQAEAVLEDELVKARGGSNASVAGSDSPGLDGLLDGSRVGQNQVPHSCELFYLYIDAHITGTYIYIYRVW